MTELKNRADNETLEEDIHFPIEKLENISPTIHTYLADELFRVKTEAGKTVCPLKVMIKAIRFENPVMNIWYLKERAEENSRLLGLSAEEVERIVYAAAYIVIRSETEELTVGQLLTHKEYEAALKSYGAQFCAGTGAKGLAEYTEQTGKKIRGLMKYFPLIFARDSENDDMKLICKDLQYQYWGIINRNERIKKLAELNAPEIILVNERRLLQELVDGTMENGLRGRPYASPDGNSLKSLADLLD